MEEFLGMHQMYIVLVIVLVIWGGIVAYLMRIEKKIKELETTMKEG